MEVAFNNEDFRGRANSSARDNYNEISADKVLRTRNKTRDPTNFLTTFAGDYMPRIRVRKMACGLASRLPPSGLHECFCLAAALWPCRLVSAILRIFSNRTSVVPLTLRFLISLWSINLAGRSFYGFRGARNQTALFLISNEGL